MQPRDLKYIVYRVVSLYHQDIFDSEWDDRWWTYLSLNVYYYQKQSAVIYC